MYRRILVTLDGSKFAEAAIPAAIEIARRTGGELRLLTVAEPGWTFVTESGWTYTDNAADQAAHDAAAGYLATTRVGLLPSCPRVTTVVRHGYPADAIMAEADDYDADLLVMATHGRGAFKSMWLGGVARQCVRHAHRPMLLVRPDGKGETRTVGAAPFRRVLVPLDGSAFSERAVGSAFGLANLFGSQVELLRLVHDLSTVDREFFPETVERTDEIVEGNRGEALRYLEQVAEPMRAWGLNVSTWAAPVGDAAPAVLEEAHGDLIVMATHARSTFKRAFLGSVAAAVVRGSEGPVLVIPPEPAREPALAPHSA